MYYEGNFQRTCSVLIAMCASLSKASVSFVIPGSERPHSGHHHDGPSGI